MKTFICLVFVAAVLSVTLADRESPRDELKKLRDECNADPATRADDSLVRKAMNGEKVDVSALGPHARCMATKLGFLKANGDIDVAKVREIIGKAIDDPAKLDAAVAKCSEQKNTPEETALGAFRCLGEFRPERRN